MQTSISRVPVVWQVNVYTICAYFRSVSQQWLLFFGSVLIDKRELFTVRWKQTDITYEPRRQKTGLRGFRPGPTQIRLRSLIKWLEAWNFVFRKWRGCTIRVAKTKALISFAVTAKLICVFVFAYAKIRFSHVAAHISIRQSSKPNNRQTLIKTYKITLIKTYKIKTRIANYRSETLC